MKFFVTAFFISLSVMAGAQSYADLVSQADGFYNAGDYQKSFEVYRKALKLESKDPGDLYNAACTASLVKEKATAFQWLGLAIQNGWANISHIKQDADLNNLHDDPRWQSLLADLQKKVDKIEANYDKPLQKELLNIYEDDQGIRLQYVDATKRLGHKHKTVDSLISIMKYKDSVNLLRVTKILDERGWVGRDKIGGQANQTLFLVIQHADLKTQQKYLPMMREAAKKGNASNNSLALLEDRVALGEGRKQLYGSQIGRNTKTDLYYVLPLEDPDHVDERRAAMGLGKLNDYVKNWNIVWNADEYKKNLPLIEKWAKGNYE